MSGHAYRRGDRVEVTDKALERLRTLMREATGEEPKPNHRGYVRQVWTDGLLIDFDDGVCAPYPLDVVRPLREEVST